MSLSRLALRLAAVEALCPAALEVSGPWPTIAGPRVFDSRIDLIQADDQLDKLEGKPLLTVYTEEDVSDPYPNGKKVPDHQVVHLVVEAMIAAKGSVDVEVEGGAIQTVGALTAPISSRQHEMLLDTLEALVRRLFDTRTMAPSAALFNTVALEMQRIESYPQRAEDRVTRVAARTIKFHVKVRPDQWPAVATTPVPMGLDLLPQPLRTVAYGLPAGSSGLAVCQSIVAMMQLPAPLTALRDIAIWSDLDRDPTNPYPPQVFSDVPLQS